MPRQCIEVVRLRRGGEYYIRNLSGTASAKFRITPVSKQLKALGRFFIASRQIKFKKGAISMIRLISIAT